MENVNAALRGEARKGIFSNEDPLLPCSTLGEQYRHECFINHSGWLIRFFGGDVAKASAACLSAPPPSVDACLQSIGLMVTNPSWQTSLLADTAGKSNEEIAREICVKFPLSHRSQCVIGGVDNIMNFDQFDVSRASRFCALADEGDRALCYQHIGLSLRSQSPDAAIAREKCSTLATPFNHECLVGAGL